MESIENEPPLAFGVELSAREILEVALWLERCGAEFFRFLSESQEHANLRSFYLRLMGMEMEHENRVRQLLQSAPAEKPDKLAFDETLTDREYLSKLKKALEEHVFPVDLNFITAMDTFTCPEDAVPLALKIKEESHRMYNWLCRFRLSAEAAKVIQSLIAKEEEHLQEIRKIYRSAS
jgi:rubrerythrin